MRIGADLTRAEAHRASPLRASAWIYFSHAANNAQNRGRIREDALTNSNPMRIYGACSPNCRPRKPSNRSKRCCLGTSNSIV